MSEVYQETTPSIRSRDEKRHCETNGNSFFTRFYRNRYSPRIAISHKAPPDSNTENPRTRKSLDLVELLLPLQLPVSVRKKLKRLDREKKSPKLRLIARNIDTDGYVQIGKPESYQCPIKCSYDGNGSYCEHISLLIQNELEQKSRLKPEEKPDLIVIECIGMLCPSSLPRPADILPINSNFKFTITQYQEKSRFP